MELSIKIILQNLSEMSQRSPCSGAHQLQHRNLTFQPQVRGRRKMSGRSCAVSGSSMVHVRTAFCSDPMRIQCVEAAHSGWGRGDPEDGLSRVHCCEQPQERAPEVDADVADGPAALSPSSHVRGQCHPGPTRATRSL